ncbi:hypothetical protein [Chenggangzhangella methanolivorans]|uniref:Uncharacterized protein n=1 Tax=Chenggangzhangella methanolivorans TaxID=1437009 RepID=A0A9E6RCZ8_9HYPH|nr:hypothetical protein [Chenggangzhangella methanolivorans]QZO02561.1 hypothetical protein K6K41_22890 [Chenggangzhangella methanolivorans]
MSAALDAAARALGEARKVHERRPGDLRAELVFERARADFEAARAAEAEARAATADARRASLRTEMARLKREFEDRARALVARARPKRRRAQAQALGPLFEGAVLSAILNLRLNCNFRERISANDNLIEIIKRSDFVRFNILECSFEGKFDLISASSCHNGRELAFVFNNFEAISNKLRHLHDCFFSSHARDVESNAVRLFERHVRKPAPNVVEPICVICASFRQQSAGYSCCENLAHLVKYWLYVCNRLRLSKSTSVNRLKSLQSCGGRLPAHLRQLALDARQGEPRGAKSGVDAEQSRDRAERLAGELVIREDVGDAHIEQHEGQREADGQETESGFRAHCQSLRPRRRSVESGARFVHRRCA